MDNDTIMDYLQRKTTEFSLLSHHEVLNSLRYKELVEIEDLKDEIFKKRLDFFVLANCLKEAMMFQTGYKQLKRYLVNEIGLDDQKARVTAEKYNKASRTYKKLTTIIRNIAAYPKLDIRDLSIAELHLAVREDWVRRRSALIKRVEQNTVNGNSQAPVDWGDVQQTAQYIFSTDWFKKAKDDPNLVTYIMTELSGQVVRQSQYESSR